MNAIGEKKSIWNIPPMDEGDITEKKTRQFEGEKDMKK